MNSYWILVGFILEGFFLVARIFWVGPHFLGFFLGFFLLDHPLQEKMATLRKAPFIPERNGSRKNKNMPNIASQMPNNKLQKMYEMTFSTRRGV